MSHLTLLAFGILLGCILMNPIVLCKKIITTSVNPMSNPSLSQMNRQELTQMNTMAQIESNPVVRASSFMVDPLIIIALIALPTIGMLGVSSLIMPLIPIGIYLIQQFFPTSAGRRRRSVDSVARNWERINLLADNFNQILNRFK